MADAILQYRELRQRSDQRVERLLACHASHLTCRPGCFGCCANLSVLPVEYYSILDELRQAGLTQLAFDETAYCGFLSDGVCRIYAFRPLICRTHGLPVAFLNENLAPPQINVSYCPLNFLDISIEDLFFAPENTLDLDELNDALYQANVEFLRQRPELCLSTTDRIPLRQLVADLPAAPTPQPRCPNP
jgi:Fe-S-cluster containining protein